MHQTFFSQLFDNITIIQKYFAKMVSPCWNKNIFDWWTCITNKCHNVLQWSLSTTRFKICYVVTLDSRLWIILWNSIHLTMILSDFLFFWIWRLKDYVNFRKPNSSGTSKLFWTNSEPLMQGTQQKCWPFTSFLFSFFFFLTSKRRKIRT